MISVNEKFTYKIMNLCLVLMAVLVSPVGVSSAKAQESVELSPTYAMGSPEDLMSRATYVDLVTLAEASDVVVQVEIRRQTQVKAERAPGLAPGFARLYIEANTLALISGRTTLGESLVYLVDVPVNEKGKAPKLRKRQMLLFAKLAGRTAKGATQLQLTGKYAQFAYTPAFEERLKTVLTSLVAPQQPPIITGISDALAVPGTLVGESETQIFLTTADGSPVSLTVLRRPGLRAVWGVSWGEIIDSAARAPLPETLRWYRLACALPQRLPSSANLARDPTARRLAARDYAFVLQELGPCARAVTAN